MVDFRRCITALAMLALFVGLAGAQNNTSTMSCSTNVSVTPAMRAEGYTEQTGDIVITCTGGTAPLVNTQLPKATFQIFYGATVTSRLLAGGGISEALLLIDDPQSDSSGTKGFGPSLNQTLCTTPLTGCAAFAGFPISPNLVGAPAQPLYLGAVAGPLVAGVAGTTPAANVYQGVITTANSVSFNGVPIMPPSTTGSRTYRITNVRINATAIPVTITTGGQATAAGISITPPSSLSISNANPIVGFVSVSLSGGAAKPGNFSQCNPADVLPSGTIQFKELFNSAFKTRIDPTTKDVLNAGQKYDPTVNAQNLPGFPYNSESNFVFAPAVSTGGLIAGLADYGTRLKATFNNIPAGVTIYVSTANTASVPLIVGGTSVGPYAQLISTSGDGSGGYAPIAGGTGSLAGKAAVNLSSNTGSAIWEVVNTDPGSSETFEFGIFISYTPNLATNTPPATTATNAATVTLSYAPTYPLISSSSAIPRFSAGTPPATGILTITACRTILLYPYITNQAGFDTGLTVANTSADPFGTAPQTGSCTLKYYGGTTAAPTVPPADGDTGPIVGGAVWANTLQTLAPTFQGYMFAVCNFQYAHGFAFISDVGARNLAMGFLAIVIPDPGTTDGTRNPSPPSPGINSGEQGAH